jgi:hypothetical protein
MLRVRIGRLIPALLVIELHPEKNVQLRWRPSQSGKLLLPRTGIELKQKLLMLWRKRTHCQIHDDDL